MSCVCSQCCAIVVLVGCIQSVLVFKTQRSTDELWTGNAALSLHHPSYRHHIRYHHQIERKLSMQFNANGIGYKLAELDTLLERHSVTMTTVRKDCHQFQGGDLLTCCYLPSETYGRNGVTPIFRYFPQNCQFHHRRLESLIIYHSEHYGLIF